MTTEAPPAASGDEPTVTVPAPAVPPTVRRTRRRRRPSGAPPPLPRSIGLTGKGWLIVLGVLLVVVIVALESRGVKRVTDRIDAGLLRAIASVRTGWLTAIMRAINRVGSGWAVTAVAGLLVLALFAFKRWRHIFTFVGSVIVLEMIGEKLYYDFARPRPYDVTVIDRWVGFSLPSPPVVVLTMIAVGICYALVVAGRPRTIAKAVAFTVVALFALSRLYLGVDHPFDQLVGIALAVAIPLNAFRFFTPNEVFPVAYRRGKTAHLDIGGRRGEAIRNAVEDQLGLTVIDIKPVGLAGSGGSTPLRLRVAGDPDTYVFGKLYAMNHVRADRWYKTGRTILYGRLEDEAPFQTVRRLVQYEDYTLRLLRDNGIPTAAAYGIVELTPEREYLLVTGFFVGAVEIGDAEIDDAVIDEGLALIRKLWDCGLAHRDIKPANLLVRDGHVYLIDVAFVQVRPSPWREAVDLANMMLVLAVRTDAERVYRRALQFFSPDEIAEAFAAARGVASPTQLRTVMKKDGRDLVAQFRALAPERRPISLQRWGFMRIGMALALLFGGFLALQATAGIFTSDLQVAGTPSCGTDNLMILMAQAVPSAESVPCISSLPAGWKLGGVQIRRGEGRFWLDSDKGGKHAVEARLLPPEKCDLSGASEVPSDEVGTRRYEKPEKLPPDLRSTRSYVFDGGCVTYQFEFHGNASASLMFDADSALAFQPRAALVEEVRSRADLRLCGAAAKSCPGGS